jgi:pimeloyl-ACP methyl ester carboxylesterase
LWAPLAELDAATLAGMVAQIVGGIRCPYLALHGASPGADYGAWLQQQIPGTAFELWEGTGHFPQLVDPRRFVQRICEFASALD